MNAAVPLPTEPLPETLPHAVPDPAGPNPAGPNPALSVVPAYHRPVCQCMPSVLAVADHHHRCPHFRPA